MGFERDLRERLHSTDPPGPSVRELVHAPTFHAPAGLRVSGARVEVWTAEAVCELDVPSLEPIFARLPEPLQPPRGDSRVRDGLALLVRTSRGAATFATTDDWSEWLDVGARVLRSLLASERLPEDLRAVLEPIARYFPPDLR